ncbi:MAG: hypothetical protein HY302_13420 [Opitutae bacterium]|nr:hypothetical protein [Opitutae bacterium]
MKHVRHSAAHGVILFCALFFLPAVTDARDFSQKLPLNIKSRYFDVRYQRATWDASAFARFADSFVDLINRDFIKTDFDYPITVLVLPDRASFQRFLRREFAESNPPNFGIYLPRFKLFATYEDSGWGTFAHEIMHPLVENNLKARPPWAVEAIPSFFEKFFGYQEGNSMVVVWGFHNPWRLEALGSKLTTVDLDRLVTGREPRTGYDTSELRLISTFLWQHGKFKRMLQLISEQNFGGYSNYLEAAMELPMKSILPLWKTYLTEIAVHRAAALRVPASQIFADRETYLRFLHANGLQVPPGNLASQ